MIDPLRTYTNAAADLDLHLRNCPSCASGVSCSEGDDTAEREYRSWRALQRTEPGEASRHRTRRGATR